MANTSTHPWTVNGTRLDTYAYNIREKKGWLFVPGYNSSNLEVPGRGGEIWVPGKRRDVGQVTLAMSVWGRDVNDAPVGSDQYATWRANMDTLLALFDSTYGLLDVRQQISASITRQAFCECPIAIDPEKVENWGADFKVLLRNPTVYWQDTADVTFTSPISAAAVALHSATQFLGATAPMEDLYLVVDGSITNPRITDERTGHYIQLNATIAAGTQWVVNTSTWSSRTGSAIEFTDTGTIRTDITVSDGMHLPRLFALSPASSPAVAPQIRLGGTGTGANTRLRVRGRRKFQ